MCAILSKLHNQQPFSFDQMDGDDKEEGGGEGGEKYDNKNSNINNGDNGDSDDGKRRKVEYPFGVKIHSLGMSSNYVIDRYAKHLNDKNIQYFKRWVGRNDLKMERWNYWK